MQGLQKRHPTKPSLYAIYGTRHLNIAATGRFDAITTHYQMASTQHMHTWLIAKQSFPTM